MDEISIFPDKEITPTEKDLKLKLGSSYNLWNQICDFVLTKNADLLKEWNYPGKKYGWNFRIKDKKRAIIYLLPRDNYFKVAFVFGDKAVIRIMESGVSNQIKTDLMEAKKYIEGRGIRIDIRNKSLIPDVELLIDIKLAK